MAKKATILSNEELEAEIEELNLKATLSDPEKMRLKSLTKESDLKKSQEGEASIFVNEDEKETKALIKIEVAKVVSNPFQARRYFNEVHMKGLSDSIVKDGLLQPVTLAMRNGVPTIIDGEKRWRAHKLAELKLMDAILYHNMTDKEFKVKSLLKNIHIQDLNCIEQGLFYKELSKEGLSIRNLAQEVKKGKSFVQERLKIASMSEAVIEQAFNLNILEVKKLYAIATIENNEELQIKILNDIKKLNIDVDAIKKLAKFGYAKNFGSTEKEKVINDITVKDDIVTIEIANDRAIHKFHLDKIVRYDMNRNGIVFYLLNIGGDTKNIVNYDIRPYNKKQKVFELIEKSYIDFKKRQYSK